MRSRGTGCWLLDRKRIAEAAERAYDLLPLAHAEKVLLLDSQAAVRKFVSEMPGWRVEGSNIVFDKPKDEHEGKIPAEEVIKQFVGYAKELERIV